jgi:hypothetical protein
LHFIRLRVVYSKLKISKLIPGRSPLANILRSFSVFDGCLTFAL